MEFFLQPKNIYIGDKAELLINCSNLVIDKNKLNEIDLENNPYETKDISIFKIEICELHSEKFLSIKFQAWKLGTVQFPNLSEFGILSELPTITVQKILDDDASLVLQEDDSAFLIPGTSFLFLEIAFVSLLFCFVIFITVRKIFLKEKIKNKKKLIKKLRHQIKRLFNKKNADKKTLIKDGEKFLRNFLYYFFPCFKQKNIYAMTYSELLHEIQNTVDDKNLVVSLETVFKQLELFRFDTVDFDEENFFAAFNHWIQRCDLFYKAEKQKEKNDNA